jgi:hypothetical protein
MNTQLSMEQMSLINAGRSKFWDGFCAGVGIIDVGWAAGLIAMTPIGGAFIIGSTLGCVIRETILQSE